MLNLPPDLRDLEPTVEAVCGEVVHLRRLLRAVAKELSSRDQSPQHAFDSISLVCAWLAREVPSEAASAPTVAERRGRHVNDLETLERTAHDTRAGRAQLDAALLHALHIVREQQKELEQRHLLEANLQSQIEDLTNQLQSLYAEE